MQKAFRRIRRRAFLFIMVDHGGWPGLDPTRSRSWRVRREQTVFSEDAPTLPNLPVLHHREERGSFVTPDELAEELTRYAGAKRGAQVGYRSAELPFASWGSFFEIKWAAEGEFAQFPVREDQLKQLRAEHPSIRESSWLPRDGHLYMNVPLDVGLTVSAWKNLVDQSYDLVWEKVRDEGRFVIEAGIGPYDEGSLLDCFIEKFDMRKQRDQILQQIVRQAALLQTRAASDESLPVGASKLGGKPDLRHGLEWPLVNFAKNPHHNEPLAFLGQINLTDVAKAGAQIPGVPKEGMLSVFSAYGWILEDNYDNWQPYSNVVLYTSPSQPLERRDLPESLSQYKPFCTLAVDPVAMLSLPNHRHELELSSLNWTDEEYERFDNMQMAFRSLQMFHRTGSFDSFSPHHRFGGYATFPQMFPDELQDDRNACMLVQFGSDNDWCSGMNWAGDGGDFVVYCDPRSERFEPVQVFIQGF